MELPSSVVGHHTAWVHCAACRPHPVRYAVDRDRLVWFADELPDDAYDAAAAGRRVFVTVHEIAGGPALAELTGSLRDIRADEVDPNAVMDLLEHVSLGRTAAEVDASIARHRSRRLLTVE